MAIVALPAETAPFILGDRVEVIRGALAGLRGSITSVTAAERVVLTVDGFPEGVHIELSLQSLEALLPESFA